jgi:hypothetical protein
MIDFSSAITAIQLKDNCLKVICPPYYSLAGLFGSIGVVVLLPALWAAIRRKSLKVLITGLCWSGIWFLVAWHLLSDSYLLFDLSANTVTINKRNFWGSRTTISIPLDQVKSSTIESGRNDHRIVLILQNGRHVGFTGYSERDGQFEAEDAINTYLLEKDEKGKQITMYFNRALVEQTSQDYIRANADRANPN